MLSCDVIIWDDNTPLFYFSWKLHSLLVDTYITNTCTFCLRVEWGAYLVLSTEYLYPMSDWVDWKYFSTPPQAYLTMENGIIGQNRTDRTGQTVVYAGPLSVLHWFVSLTQLHSHPSSNPIFQLPSAETWSKKGKGEVIFTNN